MSCSLVCSVWGNPVPWCCLECGPTCSSVYNTYEEHEGAWRGVKHCGVRLGLFERFLSSPCPLWAEVKGWCFPGRAGKVRTRLAYYDAALVLVEHHWGLSRPLIFLEYCWHSSFYTECDTDAPRGHLPGEHSCEDISLPRWALKSALAHLLWPWPRQEQDTKLRIFLCGLSLLWVTSEPVQWRELERTMCLQTCACIVSSASWTFSTFDFGFPLLTSFTWCFLSFYS